MQTDHRQVPALDRRAVSMVDTPGASDEALEDGNYREHPPSLHPLLYEPETVEGGEKSVGSEFNKIYSKVYLNGTFGDLGGL